MTRRKPIDIENREKVAVMIQELRKEAGVSRVQLAQALGVSTSAIAILESEYGGVSASLALWALELLISKFGEGDLRESVDELIQSVPELEWERKVRIATLELRETLRFVSRPQRGLIQETAERFGVDPKRLYGAACDLVDSGIILEVLRSQGGSIGFEMAREAGRLIRVLRHEKGRLQEEVALTIGIEPTHLSRIESGKVSSSAGTVLLLIKELTGVPADESTDLRVQLLLFQCEGLRDEIALRKAVLLVVEGVTRKPRLDSEGVHRKSEEIGASPALLSRRARK